MACTCSKCNYFTTEDLRNSLKILVNSVQSNNFVLYEVFTSFVTILKRTLLTEQTLKPADPDFSEDVHLQAFDAMGEILHFLQLLGGVVQNLYKSNAQTLMRMEYLHFLYFIQEYTRGVWREFFYDNPASTLSGTPSGRMQEINAQISTMVNMVSS